MDLQKRNNNEIIESKTDYSFAIPAIVTLCMQIAIVILYLFSGLFTLSVDAFEMDILRTEIGLGTFFNLSESFGELRKLFLMLGNDMAEFETISDWLFGIGLIFLVPIILIFIGTLSAIIAYYKDFINEQRKKYHTVISGFNIALFIFIIAVMIVSNLVLDDMLGDYEGLITIAPTMKTIIILVMCVVSFFVNYIGISQEKRKSELRGYSESMWICRNCMKENSYLLTLCSRCRETRFKMWICFNCNNENDSFVKFCAKCGKYRYD